MESVRSVQKGKQPRLFTVPYFAVGFLRRVRFDGTATFLFCKPSTTWGECLNYRGEWEWG